MKIRGVHHIAIKTRQLEAVESFYRLVLGLEETTRQHDEAGLRSIWFKVDSTVILMVERAPATSPDPTAQEREGRGFAVVAFAVEASARELWRSWLESKGHPIVRETQYTLYVHDPDGNLVGLSSWPTRAETRA
ncbi:MAG: VOC family protein [Deltaproteobacteria bacterium]|nr:VOC family protein [Deltaproteobacteria bacterium]